MDLVEKLISVPPREVAGGRTSNRYSYQHVWAFNLMLELMSVVDEFVLIMELHEDILILDSAAAPSWIDFYQVKTDTKPSGYITVSTITKTSSKKPDQQSIVQKLISNYSKFRPEARSIHLVSNKHFDFGELINGIPSINRDLIRLSELNAESFSKIKASMCRACMCNDCPYIDGCHNACLNLLYFDVSSLDMTCYESTVLGKFIGYLSDNNIDGSLVDAKSIFNTILSEIKRISNYETIPATRNELFQRKSITRNDFNHFIERLHGSITSEDIWKEIQPYLLHDGFSTMEVSKIAQQWKKLMLEDMNVDNLLLVTIKADIKLAIKTLNSDNSKEYANCILAAISQKPYYSAYPKEYFLAIMAKELYL